MKMQSAVDEYLVEIEVRKYTPKTIRSYRCNLNLFFSFYAVENCNTCGTLYHSYHESLLEHKSIGITQKFLTLKT